MKEYLLLFWKRAGNGEYSQSKEAMEKGMGSWQNWIGGIAQKGKLISSKPIFYQGVQIGHGERVSEPAIFEGNMVTGYLMCKADNLEEVEEWSKTCPILMNPQGFTEIREIMPFEM